MLLAGREFAPSLAKNLAIDGWVIGDGVQHNFCDASIRQPWDRSSTPNVFAERFARFDSSGQQPGPPDDDVSYGPWRVTDTSIDGRWKNSDLILTRDSTLARHLGEGR